MEYSTEKVEVQIRGDTTAPTTSSDKQTQQFDQLFDLDIITSKHPRKLGNCKAFWYDKKGTPRITVGPDCTPISRAVLRRPFFNHVCSVSLICNVNRV
jgi:hypothetical protein